MPQRPHTILEEVICDADLIHLSTEEYEKKAGKHQKDTKINNKNYKDYFILSLKQGVPPPTAKTKLSLLWVVVLNTSLSTFLK